jgi:KDO2-lipid IV(A) lauroyltransferase
VTWLPLRVLFIVSDVFFVLIYYIIGYRKKVVRTNLEKSFPEKSQKELRKIERQFYLHLCDSFVEWVYPLHRSAKEMEKHYRYLNPEVLNEFYKKGKGVVGVLGHYGNWEYLSLLPTYVDHKVWAIYQPLKNKYFNKLITDLRSKYGVNMVTGKESIRTLIAESQAGEITLTYFLADQSPHKNKIKYRTSFLNQNTPVFLGAEQVAKKLDMALVFFDIRKVKRGKYEVFFEILCENPKDTEPHELTELHVRALEKAIEKDPAWWLWSHKRWKHANPDED